MSISAGDVVFSFLGDSTQLDTKFAEIGPNAEKAFGPAKEAAEEASESIKYSMGEARGEVALLGEEFGIRLPRHVRSFVAELPGVGKALSAAFSATAILFVVQALVELSKKLSDALAEFISAKSVMEEHKASVIALNQELLNLTKQYEELKKKADDYGKSALQLAGEHKGEVKESIAELTKTLSEEESQFKSLIKSENEHTKTVLGATAAYDAWKSGNLSALQALKAYTVGVDTSILKHKEHDEIENKLLITNQKLKTAHEELRVATNNVTTAQDALNKKGAALEEQVAKTANEINSLNIALNHTKVEAAEVEIVTPAQIKNILAGVEAAHNFSITMRGDLVQALQDAKKALYDFSISGIDDTNVQKKLTDEVNKAAKALENYGGKVDSFQVKSHGMWKELQEDAAKGATKLDQVKQLGVTAFDALAKGIESSLQTAILSQGSFTTALEKATASALASIASQALVKAMFYSAEGFAALAGQDYPGATEFFEAAGIMGAVGGAAALAGHALAGAGGPRGGSTAQLHNSVSNTTSQGGGFAGASGVQHLAEGGLLTQPILAVAGEAGREAVIPLDDPRSKEALQDTLGGGSSIHFHLPHGSIISADVMSTFVDKMNRMVNRGQLHVQATNSFRVTKRSA